MAETPSEIPCKGGRWTTGHILWVGTPIPELLILQNTLSEWESYTQIISFSFYQRGKAFFLSLREGVMPDTAS